MADNVLQNQDAQPDENGKNSLIKYLSILAKKPHVVNKKINGRIQPIKEYFITDLVEHMVNDGLTVGYVIAPDEQEVMGVDDVKALGTAQKIFRERCQL